MVFQKSYDTFYVVDYFSFKMDCELLKIKKDMYRKIMHSFCLNEHKVKFVESFISFVCLC